MFLSAYLTVWVLAQADLPAGVDPRNAMRVSPTGAALSLSWHDTEEVLEGAVTTYPPRAGQPVRLSVHVAPYAGAPFTGPITFALRPTGQLGGGESVTVTPDAQGLWVFTPTPPEAGTYVLEVSYRTTRLKLVRGLLVIEAAAVPGWVQVALAALLLALVVGSGAWVIFHRDEV
jgi:hypothetical protein